MARDYAKEYRDYQGKPEQIANRSDRNQARREMGLKVGDPREVDHKTSIKTAVQILQEIYEPLVGVQIERKDRTTHETRK